MRIYPGLSVGSQLDYEYSEWGKTPAIIHACKYPYYMKRADGVKGPPFCEPTDDYYFIEDDGVLYLNIVDANDPKYFPKVIFDKTFEFINKHISNEGGVFIHCNKGQSRAPGIAMMYLSLYTDLFDYDMSYNEAFNAFRTIYPHVSLGAGMAYKVKECFDNPDMYLSTQLNSEVGLLRTK